MDVYITWMCKLKTCYHCSHSHRLHPDTDGYHHTPDVHQYTDSHGDTATPCVHRALYILKQRYKAKNTYKKTTRLSSLIKPSVLTKGGHFKIFLH